MSVEEQTVIGASPRSSGAKAGAALLLVALAAVLCVARRGLFQQPFECDITYYGTLAHELVNGRQFYSWVFDHKPWAIHVTYSIAELVAGYGPSSVYLMSVSAGILTMLGVFCAASAMGPSSAGLWAAGIWTIISGTLELEGNQPNTEVFTNTFLIWAFALLLRISPKRSGVMRVLFVGILMAAATLYKHVFIAPAAAMAIGHAIAPPEGEGAIYSRKRAVMETVLMAAIVGFAWVAIIGYFVATGRGGLEYDALITFNRIYAGNLHGNLVNGLRPSRLFPDIMEKLSALILLILATILLFGHRLSFRVRVLSLAYTLGIYLALAVPGKYFGHYYLLWFPLISVGGGWAVASWGKSIADIGAKALSALPGLLVLSVLVWYQWPSYKMPPDHWSTSLVGDTYLTARDTGREIQKMLKPNESLYNWGSDTGLYYYSQRRPPTGYLSTWGMNSGAMAEKLTTKVLRELTAQPPDMVAVTKIEAPSGLTGHPVLDWLSSRYKPLPDNGDRGYWKLYMRTGSNLESRMTTNATVSATTNSLSL